jgi:hypothetical protein
VLSRQFSELLNPHSAYLTHGRIHRGLVSAPFAHPEAVRDGFESDTCKMTASIASITQEEVCVFCATTNLTGDKVYMHKQPLRAERWPQCSRTEWIESIRPEMQDRRPAAVTLAATCSLSLLCPREGVAPRLRFPILVLSNGSRPSAMNTHNSGRTAAGSDNMHV